MTAATRTNLSFHNFSSEELQALLVLHSGRITTLRHLGFEGDAQKAVQLHDKLSQLYYEALEREGR